MSPARALVLLILVAAPALAADGGEPGMSPATQLVAAGGLLVLAAGLLLLELIVVSFGLLTVASAVAAYFACAMAWKVSPIAGWIWIAVCPLAAAAVIRIGLKWVQRSRLVPKDVIGDDAGIRHEATRLGIAAGSVGTLVTDALPTGRARFERGELDVQVEGRGLSRGASVAVVRIDGPIVFVVASDAAASSASTSRK